MAELVCARPDVVLCEDWEDKTGQPTSNGWYDWAWGSPWLSPVVDSTFGHTSNRALKITVWSNVGPSPAERNYSGFVRNTVPNVSQGQSLYLRFYLYFSGGFVFVPGGSGAKLCYFNSWLGSQSQWRTRFSYAKTDGPGTKMRIGVDLSTADPVLTPNVTQTELVAARWYLVEGMIKINTPGQSNGEVRWWVDEVLNGQYTGQNINGGSAHPCNGITIDQYFGGAEENPRPQQYAWYDSIVAAAGYIGPKTVIPVGTVPGSAFNLQRRHSQ